MKQQQKDVWTIFADFEKAYDTVEPIMWQVLQRFGVPDELIFVLRKLYSDIVINLKGCGKNVRIPSTVGVKQGDNLATIFLSSSSTLWESPYQPSENGPESKLQ